jgi:hypothetical protein
MSIRPIDIQTVLAQLSQVGRDQSIEKEGAALQASIQGAAEQKRRDEAKEAIHRAEDNETTTAPVKERERSARRQPGKEEGPEGAPEGGEDQADDGTVVRDPDLGSHIDLTG